MRHGLSNSLLCLLLIAFGLGIGVSPQIAWSAKPPDRKVLAKWNERQARAESLLAESKTSKALEEATKALSLAEQLGREFPELVETLELIGGIQAGNGQHDDAITNFGRAVRIREAAQGKSVDLLEPMMLLGQSLLFVGRLDEARELGDDAVAVAEEHYGANDVRLAELCAAVGLFHFASNSLKSAVLLLSKSIDIHKRALVQDEQALVRLMSVLGTTQVLLGEYADAELALSRVLSNADETPGFHPTEQIGMSGLLLEAIVQQGKTEEAIMLKQRIQSIYGALNAEDRETFRSGMRALARQWTDRGWANGVNAVNGLLLVLDSP